MITEENEGKNEKTNLTEVSDQAVCRICLGTEFEGMQIENDQDEDFNPLISPCKCTGTMGMIHAKCLKAWLETKGQKKIHRAQTMYTFK